MLAYYAHIFTPSCVQQEIMIFSIHLELKYSTHKKVNNYYLKILRTNEISLSTKY